IAAIMIHRCPGNKQHASRSATHQMYDFRCQLSHQVPLGVRSRLSSTRQCLGPVPPHRFRTFTILVSYPEPTRYVQCDIPLNIPEGERDIVSPRVDQFVSRQKDAKRSAGSHLIFSRVEHAARKATLMVTDRVTVFDQPPKMLPAAECAAHRHFASSEHDEIA